MNEEEKTINEVDVTDTSNSYDISSYVSSEESAILSSLSEKEIFLNVSSITDLCFTWNSRITSLNLTAERVASDFKVLTSYGIVENYITNLSTAVNFLTQNVNQVSQKINDTKEQQVIVDNSYSEYKSSDNYNYSTDSVNNSYTGTNTSVNNNTLDANVNHESNLGTLNYQDYFGLSSSLSSIVSNSNISLEELIATVDNASMIKEELLKSFGLSDELKTIITAMEPEVLLIALKALYANGALEMPDSSVVQYLYYYLERVASLNNISLSSLITDTNNKDLLYNSINYYNDAVEHFNKISNNGIIFIRSDLLRIYDGDNIGNMNSEVVNSVRSVIDIMASSSNSSYEYLLNNGKLIEDNVRVVSDSKPFINSLVDCDAASLQGILNALFSGK